MLQHNTSKYKDYTEYDDDDVPDNKRIKNARLRDSMAGVKRPHLPSKESIKHKIRNVVKKDKELVGKFVSKEREIVGKVVEKEKNIIGKVVEKKEEIVGKVKKGFEFLKSGTAGLEKKMFEDAVGEFEDSRSGNVLSSSSVVVVPPTPVNGFVVLGMHRSGTSMLAGLLVKGFNYKVGEPLIKPNYDNEKGFFELLPAVLQNDAFLRNQNASWTSNIRRYDSKKAYQAWQKNGVDKREGNEALKVLRDNEPWLQKDPRMCITLRTWLSILAPPKRPADHPAFIPAAVFTYRHPLEVAMSLSKRQDFELHIGFRLWIIYNQLGIQNSQDLCRVHTSNTAVLADPMTETNRIVKELTERCHVVKPDTTKSSQTVVDGFVDPKLQANKKKLEENKAREVKILETRNKGTCLVKDYSSRHKEGSDNFKSERKLYLKAMKIYCDLESGEAYTIDYKWPSIE